MSERSFLTIGDQLTKALIGADFALYQSLLTLPVKFSPRQGKAYVLEDEQALREDFDLYVSIIRLHHVTDIYRQLLAHAHVANGIQVRWMTHIMVSATRLVDPFETRMLLMSDGDGWRIAEIESSEGHLHWTLARAVVSPEGKFEILG